MYKVITKILALHIKKVIANVIDEVQSAFVEGRNILEGPLIVNKIFSWAKSNGRKILLLKVDFNKAFDSVNWGYIDSIMAHMNFWCKWRSLIQGCLVSDRASIIINGSPTAEVSMTKVVRQEDPLYPFLFIIAMEGINIAMKSATSKGISDGIHIPNTGVCLSHLLYADDVLF